MGELTGGQLTVFLLDIVLLLSSAHVMAAVAKRLGQPQVLGEMLAGLLLGPTFLGQLFPEFQQWLFPAHGAAASALDGLVVLAVILLLMVAGMEVNLSDVWKHGRSAIVIALGASVVPLCLGFVLAMAAPHFWGKPNQADATSFAIFLGTALAVSALPVIAKILLDLDLFQSDFGVLNLVSATICNLVAWLAFSVVLGGPERVLPLWLVILLTLGFVAATLTIGRWISDQLLGLAQVHLSWPSGVLGFMLILGLLGASFTHAIGVHAIFGAFLTGIALGESKHMRDQTRQVVMRFVEGILAPIFVAAIGLRVNFVANFQPLLVASVLVVGIAAKVLTTYAGARLVKTSSRESWALGWALSARGELGIVLALLAWQGGIIRERLFVAMVVLAIVTSAMAGPMLVAILQLRRLKAVGEMLDLRKCLPQQPARDQIEAIRMMCEVAAESMRHDVDSLLQQVMRRERIMGTGIGHGVAVPHARLDNLSTPVLILATFPVGLRFAAVDDQPVRIVFLIFTPEDDPTSQLQILASIGKLVQSTAFTTEALAAQTPTELLGVTRVSEQALAIFGS